MFCPDCGTRNADNSNYCSNCGKPLRQGADHNPSIEYEQCHIVWNSKIGFYSTEVWFWAKAIGPQGVFSAGASPHYQITFGFANQDFFAPYSSNDGIRRKANAVHEALMRQLVSCEPTGHRLVNLRQDVVLVQRVRTARTSCSQWLSVPPEHRLASGPKRPVSPGKLHANYMFNRQNIVRSLAEESSKT